MVQILSLFLDYDMSWPHATKKTLAFAGAFNIGVTLTAPEVRKQGPLQKAANMQRLQQVACI